jgi:hypothetical protein
MNEMKVCSFCDNLKTDGQMVECFSCQELVCEDCVVDKEDFYFCPNCAEDYEIENGDQDESGIL